MIVDFEKFKKVTGYDIKQFLTDCSSFFSDNYQDIVDFYMGSDNVPTIAFNELNRLNNEVSKIEPLFRTNSNRLDTIDMWEILDLFTEMQVKLMTASKTAKWMRSSRLNSNDTSVKISRIQTQNETLESVAREVGYQSPQNDWKNIALDNLLIEEDYTMEGGTMITLTFKNNANLSIDNIVDYFTGDNVKGKDINRKFTFVNNDLNTVSGNSCLEQSFKIKLEIMKNSIPEFPNYGSYPDAVGTSVAALSFPSRMKDIMNLFSQDKRWSNFSVLNVKRDGDIVQMSVQAQSILSDIQNTNIIL